MPSELQNRDDPDTTTSILSPKKMKKKKKNGDVSNQGVTLVRANEMKKKAIGNKPSAASKNSCICAPTAHAGSFKCRLHRVGAPQKSSSNLSGANDSKRNAQSFNSMNSNTQCCHQ